MSIVDGRYAVAPSGCWVWLLSKDTNGYGHMRHNGRLRNAHILSYEEKFGPVPAGRELDHLCRARECVNPDHVEAVPHVVNVRRGRGGDNWRSKTHCVKGHEFNERNTRIRPTGGRTCRACDRARYPRKEAA